MSLTLPPNVRIDDTTGLYIITNSKGQTFRVNAQDQAQLDAYVQSVNTNTPTTITAINPATGLPVTSGFNPEFILNQRKELEDFFALQRETKQKTGIVGNKDGTYTDLKSNPTVSLTLEQAQERIAAAGLPPNALASVTPKNSPSYFAATRAVDETTNIPSSLPPSPQPNSTQPPPAISSDNLNLSASSDPNTNPEGVRAADPVVPVDQSIIDANADPQSAQDLEFQLQQEQLQAENEGPQPVTGDDAYQDFLQNTATEDIEPTYGYTPPEVDDPYPVADLGELGVNTDLPTDAALGELGINTDLGTFGGSSNTRGIQGATDSARAQADLQDATNFSLLEDWRVRLKLAPGANYLYRQPGYKGILEPLIATDGVIFPYTPSISVSYAASYDSTSLTHSNYKVFQYQGSSVDNLQVTCEFTAQDTFEANYLLAVIHFFRSVTKMFYGKDQDPKPGTPPPLCYLIGLGNFQFNEHPLVVTNFTYALPNDVDYIRASSPTVAPGTQQSSSGTSKAFRLQGTGVVPGGNTPPAQFQNSTKPTGTIEPTYVPTKIQLQFTALPIVSRKDISDNFSLKAYGTGELLQGSKRSTGGIW